MKPIETGLIQDHQLGFLFKGGALKEGSIFHRVPHNDPKTPPLYIGATFTIPPERAQAVMADVEREVWLYRHHEIERKFSSCGQSNKSSRWLSWRPALGAAGVVLLSMMASLLFWVILLNLMPSE